MEGHASVIAGLHNTWFGCERAPETQERLAKLRTIQELEAEEVTSTKTTKPSRGRESTGRASGCPHITEP